MPEHAHQLTEEDMAEQRRDIRRKAIRRRRSGKAVRICRNGALPEQADADEDGKAVDDTVDEVAQAREARAAAAQVRQELAGLRPVNTTVQDSNPADTPGASDAMSRCHHDLRRRARRTR